MSGAFLLSIFSHHKFHSSFTLHFTVINSSDRNKLCITIRKFALKKKNKEIAHNVRMQMEGKGVVHWS